jgi:hypothetical protein
MKSVKSSPQLSKLKSGITTPPMKRNISADSLAELAEMYQSFTVSKASLESLPCVVSAATTKYLDNENKIAQLGACLATPPDVSCSYDEEIPFEIKTVRRRDNVNDDDNGREVYPDGLIIS